MHLDTALLDAALLDAAKIYEMMCDIEKYNIAEAADLTRPDQLNLHDSSLSVF